MAILIISQKWEYGNPTAHRLLRELQQRRDVVLAGWGLPTPSDSVARLSQIHGKFDAILVDPWVLQTTPSQYYDGLRPPDLFDYGAPIVLNLLQYDIHNLTEEFFREFIDPCSYVVSSVASPQFWKFSQPSPSDVNEHWFDPSGFPIRCPHFIDERFLMVPHCVGPDEIIRPKRKRRDFSVMGVKYDFRTRALEYIRHQGFSHYRATKLDSAVAHLNTNYYSSKIPFVRRWYRSRFRLAIERARLSVTCDGSVGYAVRKFFEIPAFGSVLAGRFFPNPEGLGFVDGRTAFFLDADHVERLTHLQALASGNAAEYLQVLNAGQEMVRECHTVARRADQLLAILEAIGAGSLNRMRWERGDMKIS